MHARASDAHDDTKGEALVGLARREDARMLEPLTLGLGSDSVGRLAVEAAEDMGDPRLYPALARLKSRWATYGPDAMLLEAALAKCSPEQAS